MEKAVLLRNIERSWASLDERTAGLSERQLTTPGPDGWSPKDHLAHLGVWDVPSEVDPVNELLHRRHRDLVVDEVKALQLGSRQMVREALGRLTDADLSRPYASFQPSDPGSDRDQPVLGWITGNTNEHADEHLGYIRALAGSASASEAGIYQRLR